ncbi:glutaredoxin-like protein NrdH [Fructilactobacillus ixorae]|uniref:Glutaredoxin-like protein NrdH n=2 Tax=Fructilactobacillus TaxID=2767881 RepID=A0ABY5BMM1_9LACO|nr:MULTISPECIES: glutaredoxin-like protein NrdH [Fructilactobacillus]USS84927.1 glutaredoxin-like protein NrdH [Fructilactobacillus myrtifloralis]USS93591.1 glutaredoxin-like protein NrdH [Fructilactobacillus ixorae]
MKQITVYTKDNCIQCKMTKRFLTEHNVDFTEQNTSENPDLIPYLKAQGFQAVPVVESEIIDSFGGFRPDQLQKLVDALLTA